jgi:hypothetical protein
MTFADAGGKVSQRILVRLTDPVQGPRLQALSIATIRSVATGVVGVAVIQSVLLGSGLPARRHSRRRGAGAAGVVPRHPAIAGLAHLVARRGYLWWMGEGGTVAKVIFTIWFLVAGMADNVLKPLLLGRGVDAPMLVILIGAIGGMVTGGITGLFLGAVLLAVGYQIFMEWVDHRNRRRRTRCPPITRSRRVGAPVITRRRMGRFGRRGACGRVLLSGCVTLGPDYQSRRSTGCSRGNRTCTARPATPRNRRRWTCASGGRRSTIRC